MEFVQRETLFFRLTILSSFILTDPSIDEWSMAELLWQCIHETFIYDYDLPYREIIQSMIADEGMTGPFYTDGVGDNADMNTSFTDTTHLFTEQPPVQDTSQHHTPQNRVIAQSRRWVSISMSSLRRVLLFIIHV